MYSAGKSESQLTVTYEGAGAIDPCKEQSSSSVGTLRKCSVRERIFSLVEYEFPCLAIGAGGIQWVDSGR